jgi:parallel beta helix pectate lyase-like protein
VRNRVHDLAVPCLDGGGNGGSGISAGSGRSEYDGHDLLVAENVVSRIGTGALDGECRLVHGIYASVPRVTIVNNIVHHAVGDGISSWHAASDLTISNNLSADNGGAGILVGSGDSGATGEGNVRTQVTNNVVHRNARTGIIESSDGEHPVGPGNRYLNNLLSENGGGDGGLLVRRGGSLVSENVEAGPRFTDPSGEAYRLAAGSPAIDAGTCAGAPSSSIDGVARPQGSAVDIGPYERRSQRGSCGG